MTTKVIAKVGQLITADKVAERLGLHIETVRTMTRRGDFAGVASNLGTTRRPLWRYDEARLERWISDRRAA